MADWIHEALQSTTRRSVAIKVLNASKTLVASDQTASYGGRYTLLPHHMADIREALPIFKEIGIPVSSQDTGPRPPAAYELAAELIKVNRKLKTSVSATGPIPKSLSGPEFKRVKRALRSVKDGSLGRLIEAMTVDLAADRPPSDITVDEYKDTVAELDGKLHQLAPVGTFLRALGSALSVANDRPDMEPSSGPGVSWYFWTGNTLKILGANLEIKEITPLFASPKTWRLCGYWLKVKRGLGLKESTVRT